MVILCSVYDTFSQDYSNKVMELGKLFEQNVTNRHQEKVYLHTDRSLYVTGETIWMSSYCVDATFHNASGLSKVVNVELINSKGESIKKERIQLVKGLGKGQIFMSPDIPSGVYLLRGFTNWMKNFDSNLVFTKRITVLNPSSPPLVNTEEAAEVDLDLSFFPEGGNLIAGLKSKIAIKANDNQGNGVSVSGIIFDQNDYEVAKFTTSQEGYTFFLMTPKEGDIYNATIALDGKIKNYKLPEPTSSGAILSVVNLTQGEFVIGISQRNLTTTKLYYVLHTRGLIKEIKELDANAQNSIRLAENELPDGISHITLLDAEFNPLTERLIFNYPKTATSLNIALDKKEYTNREKVSISIESKDLMIAKDMANLSLSVFQTSGAEGYEDNIISNLLFTSEIKGGIPNPGALFNESNLQRKSEMDLIMLTHGWRRFNWTEVIKSDVPNYKYPAELNAPILSGKFTPQEDEKMPRSIFMGLSGKASILNSADFDKEGNFHFDVPFRIQNKKALFLINSPTLSAEKVHIYDPFDLTINRTLLPQTIFTIESKKYLENLNANIQLSQVYRDYNNVNGVLNNQIEPNFHFYGEPDYTYILDDYTRFETIKDLFIEFIRSAVIRKRDKETGFYVVADGLFPGKALTLIDGIPIMDTDFILNFDPLKVEKIGVVTNIYFMGNTGFQGMINFTTYAGDFDLDELPEYLVEKAYQGIQQSREFYSPNYSIQKDVLKRIPDYRNTIYWNPNIELKFGEKVDLEFYTSDTSGFFDIEINGISTSGSPIFKKARFTVLKNLP
jgi:hypothetical protein